MAFWRRFLQRPETEKLASCTALDIGTEYAKALVCEISDDGVATVRGVGRKRQGLSHMQSGTVADISAVVENCRAALDEAKEMAGFLPTAVIIGIAGELVKGFTASVSQERKHPDQQLTERELDGLIAGVQRDALREAERTVTWETGLPNVDIRLVHAAVTGATIDGYTVTNPVGFHGRHVRISVFNAFAPLIHLGALQSVASQLSLELVAIVAEPYAVGRCIDDQQLQQSGALFVDVGGGTTDVALVRQGGIEGTRMFALGGRAFTKSLADRLDMPFERAEQIKVDYAKGGAVWHKEEVGQIIGEDITVWQAGVELVLEEFAKSGMLPGRIYLCGGGARLPQIGVALGDPALAKHLSFVRPPHAEKIKVGQVAGVVDATGLLVDEQDITPMALAHQAVEMTAKESALDAALRRVLKNMKV